MYKPLTTRLLPVTLAVLLAAIAFGCAGEDTASDRPEIDSQAAVQPSLQDQLDERKQAFAEQAPPEMITTFAAGLDTVRQTGILDSAVNVGDRAPDFTLPDAYGDTVVLSDLLMEGPVVISWYRGGWCPYCNLELLALRRALPEIEQTGAMLVAISPEVPDSAMSTVDRDSLDFLVLSDLGNETARDYGIVFKLPPSVKELYESNIDLPAYNKDESWELPLAATYVIDTDGIVRYAFLDVDYTRRAEPQVIIDELKKLESN